MGNFQNCCNCHSQNENQSPKPQTEHLKAYIDTRFCGANQDHCRPMKECPNQAIEVAPDETSGFGHHFTVNEDKCDGCGQCMELR